MLKIITALLQEMYIWIESTEIALTREESVAVTFPRLLDLS